MLVDGIPERLGRYKVLRLLGRGGMGEVYLAVDPVLNRQVAIKVLPASRKGDENLKARFMTEARAVAALNHPNVVTIHEAGFTGPEDEGLEPGTPFLVMEYIHGSSLGHLLDRRKLTLEESGALSVQIAEGLKAAHARRIIHRDVKPSNVMVTDEGRAKILDFGLSKLLQEGSASGERLTATGMVAGTLEYFSPEQALGQALDERTDLFSFGIVLYEMLTGTHPFEGDSAAEKMAHILTQPARRWPADVAVPDAYRAIVEKALRKEPERRYANAEELLRDLDVARRGLPVSALLPSAPVSPAADPAITRAVPSAAAPAAAAAARALPLPLWISGIGVVAALAGLTLFFALGRRGKTAEGPGEKEPLKPTQLTSSASLDLWPSFSPDGNSVAYASDKGGTFQIYVKQLVAGGNEIRVTNDAEQNLQPAWSPDGRSLAFTTKNKGGIWVVPALGGVPRRLTQFGMHPEWSPDGKLLAFQSDAVHDLSAGAVAALPPSTIWIVPAGGGTPQQITQVGVPKGGHGAPTWSPDGRRIVFVTYVRPRSELWAVAPDGRDLKPVSTSQPFYYDPVFSPDGKWLYFSSATPNSPSGVGIGLWRLAVDAGEKGVPSEVLTTGLATIRQLAFSANGRKLAYAALTTQSNLFSISLTDGAAPPMPLTTGTGRNSRPAYSPDGTRIVFTSWRSGSNNDLWLMDADGKNPVQLTTDPGQDDYPSWFPEGDRLAFLTSREGSLKVYQLDLKSRQESLLKDLGPEMESPRLSSDGKWIAFNSKKGGGTTNVWVAPLGGGEPRQVTFDKELAGFPCWSPDSRFLAFEVKRGDDYHVAVAPREGGSAVQLTAGHGVFWPYSFFPDGDKVVAVGLRDGVWNIYAISRATRIETPLTRFRKLNAYVRYPAVAPKGERIAYEMAETTGNVWMIEKGK